jgi:orotate phosphoribosyltransferase
VDRRCLELGDQPVTSSLADRVARTARLTGEFRLRSGVMSSEYFDKYRFEADPVLLRDLAAQVAELVPPGADALAGLELGGVPIAVVVSQLTGLPTRFIRKTAKEYGTRELSEGGPVTGLRLVIVEDVITSGGAVLSAVAELRALGAIVETVVCVVDRESGGAEALGAAGLTLRAVFRRSDLLS